MEHLLHPPRRLSIFLAFLAWGLFLAAMLLPVGPAREGFAYCLFSAVGIVYLGQWSHAPWNGLLAAGGLFVNLMLLVGPLQILTTPTRRGRPPVMTVLAALLAPVLFVGMSCVVVLPAILGPAQPIRFPSATLYWLSPICWMSATLVLVAAQWYRPIRATSSPSSRGFEVVPAGLSKG